MVGEGSNLFKTYIKYLSQCVTFIKLMFEPVKGAS